jgi:hypothetical protein
MKIKANAHHSVLPTEYLDRYKLCANDIAPQVVSLLQRLCATKYNSKMFSLNLFHANRHNRASWADTEPLDMGSDEAGSWGVGRPSHPRFVVRWLLMPRRRSHQHLIRLFTARTDRDPCIRAGFNTYCDCRLVQHPRGTVPA